MSSGCLLRETGGRPTRAVGGFEEEPVGQRVIGCLQPDVIRRPVAPGALVGEDVPAAVPAGAAVPGLAVGEEAAGAGGGVEEVELVELAAAGVHRVDEFVVLRPPAGAADGFLEERELVAGPAGLVDAVDLADIAESRADEHALAVERPVEVSGGADVLVAVHVVHEPGRDLGNVLEDEVAVVEGAVLDLG